MDGVATAIVGFIFVCIIYPQLIKNRHQYYLALAAILLAMVFQSFATIIGSAGLMRFVAAMGILLEVVAIVLLVLASGGLTASQLAGDVARAYEVMRRGETEKTAIIPPPGQRPGAGKISQQEEDDDTPKRDSVDQAISPAPATPPSKHTSDSRIPLE